MKFTFKTFPITDDCLYLYYVCTDKLGTWPQNKQKCFQTFENCQSSIGNDDGDYIDSLPSTVKPIVTSTTEKQPLTTTSTVPPVITTKQPRPTTTTTTVRILIRVVNVTGVKSLFQRATEMKIIQIKLLN